MFFKHQQFQGPYQKETGLKLSTQREEIQAIASEEALTDEFFKLILSNVIIKHYLCFGPSWSLHILRAQQGCTRVTRGTNSSIEGSNKVTSPSHVAFIFDRATSYSIKSAHHLGTSSVPIAIFVCGICRSESPLAGIAFSNKNINKAIYQESY